VDSSEVTTSRPWQTKYLNEDHSSISGSELASSCSQMWLPTRFKIDTGTQSHNAITMWYMYEHNWYSASCLAVPQTRASFSLIDQYVKDFEFEPISIVESFLLACKHSSYFADQSRCLTSRSLIVPNQLHAYFLLYLLMALKCIPSQFQWCMNMNMLQVYWASDGRQWLRNHQRSTMMNANVHVQHNHAG